MPLDRLVLILVVAIAGAALTVWVAAFAGAALQLGPWSLLVAVPVVLFLYVFWRVVADRLRDRRNDPRGPR
ncbi:hypothetical protein OCGS_2018 [Oceaniovalibus guishaninsula JLT2003]|uniref:Uncharacterized protein n=1 Tax=Oceaniovalibus guishaninsula JLT2003 TaxID=1231392 RepID=K2HBQ1_9RHOB|nr:hypothetical protein [Oceaniovalibus guishaninsula]EKE44037.1 hypothetical protein OCGS_2018 [Oceaniovalibus guishaninsula JLT2003]